MLNKQSQQQAFPLFLSNQMEGHYASYPKPVKLYDVIFIYYMYKYGKEETMVWTKLS